MRAQQIDDNIYLIQLNGLDSNIYLINKEVLIDSGTGFNFSSLKKALNGVHVNIENIKRIVNTHCHFDHVGGNVHFNKAKIALHELDAPALEDEKNMETLSFMFGVKLNPRRVDIKLKDKDLIRIRDVKLNVIHTPGHTKGSVCLYDEKNRVLFTGDTVFADNVGRYDLIGGSRKDLLESIKKIQGLDIKALLPGHGPILLGDMRLHIQKMPLF